MTPGDPDRGPLEAFAAEVVGLGPDLAEADRLAWLLRKLEADDFLPDPIAHGAILALGGRPIPPASPLREEAGESEERRLHAEVERYAAEFFDLPVASRVDRYRSMGLACARHPRLIERLRCLKAGLMIDRGALADPSPAVGPLLDDLLALFPLRAALRGAEARDRARRFRSDPALTDLDRSRASKDLAKRHPEVASLGPDYLSRLVRVRRRGPAARLRAGARKWLRTSIEGNARAYWVLAVILLGWLGRIGTPTTTPRALPPAPIFSTAPVRPPTSPPSPLGPSPRGLLQVEVGRLIRREVIKHGKAIDEPTMTRLVAALPLDDLARVDRPSKGLGAALEARDRFLDRLKEGLKGSGLGLTDAEVADLAPRCLPKSPGLGAP